MYVDFCANISKMVIAKEEKILEKTEARNDRIAGSLETQSFYRCHRFLDPSNIRWRLLERHYLTPYATKSVSLQIAL